MGEGSGGVGPVSRNEFYIGGKWVKPSSDRKFSLVNASTGEVLGTAPEAMEADVDRAVASARAALEKSAWTTMTVGERSAVMQRFAESLAKRSSEMARTVSAQNGMPVSIAEVFEGQFPAGLLIYYAQLTAASAGEEVRPSQMGKETLVSRNPIGVVAAVVPWNFPVVLAMTKIAPAMAAGCTLVIKPSPGTVFDSYVFAEAAEEAGVPAGVLNWVAADRTVGAYLVSHPGVDKVAFTGSTSAGRIIASTCGQMLRPVTLELGGKSAAIILDDANLDAVAQGLQSASLFNNGQACYNGTRILAPAHRYKETVEAIGAMMAGLKVGNALDPSTMVGPMASSLHRDRVEGYIAKGKQEAKLVTGGGRPKGVDGGWFVEPTLFADVTNSHTIAREEIFGPVLSVIPYKDDADAVRIANESEYGLGGSIWSTNGDRAKALARQVQTGTIGINGYTPAIGSPFGGVKASGLGRELGPEALSSYQQWKSIYVMN